MRCFLPCFGTCKRPKHLPSANATPIQGGHTHVAEGAILLAQQKTVVEEPVDLIAESKIKDNKSAEVTSSTKEEHEEEGEKHQEESSSESLFSLSISSTKVSPSQTAESTEVNSPMQLKLQEQLPSSIDNDIKKEQSSAKEPNEEEKGKEISTNHPPVPEYRYRDCSDEGYDDINLDEGDLEATFEEDDHHNEKKRGEGEEGTDVHRKWVQEESSESLFSLSTESRKRISSAEEAENEVNSLMHAHHMTQEESKGRIENVCSVLKPIENLNQERVVKATTVLQPLKKDKENVDIIIIPISPEPILKLSNRKRLNDKKKEIGVDTSLSSWLVQSERETTPVSMNNSTNSVKGGKGSSLSHDDNDRPILGALTVEEIRMYSLSTSTRRSRSRSPDETPIIGTVGSYWSHTGQNLDLESNRSGKDVEKLKWSSTTMKTRLEGAFEATVAAQL